MGLKDFTRGLGDAASTVGGAVSNVAKATAYVANPTHIDDIAKATGRTAQFVAENPGIIADVGTQIIKEELKPKNLLINAALIGASVATGGAAAPAAIAARTAMGARGVKTGITAVKAGEAAVEVGRTARYLKRAKEIGTAAEKTLEGGKDAGRIARGMEKINDVRKKVSPVTNIVHGQRTRLGEKVLEGGTGPVRQALANVVQGTGGIGRTTRMAGQTDAAYKAQQRTRQVKMARKTFNAAQAAPAVTSAVADPAGYAMKKAMQSVKMGDTGEGEYTTAPGGQAIVSPRNAGGIEVSNNGIVQPSGWQADMEPGALRGAQRLQNFGAGVAASNTLGGGNAFWKGPSGSGREAFGGIGADYTGAYQQRDVNQVTRSSAFQTGQLGSLAQPTGDEGETKPGGRPKPLAGVREGRPTKPPTMPPMAVSASPGPRMLPLPGAGVPEGRKSTFYKSGVSTEQADVTMGGTLAWNAKGQGSFAFPELTQPTTEQPKQATDVGTVQPAKKVSTRKSGIGPQGMSRIKAWQQEPDTTTPAPWMTTGVGNEPRVGNPNAVAPGAPATLPKRTAGASSVAQTAGGRSSTFDLGKEGHVYFAPGEDPYSSMGKLINPAESPAEPGSKLMSANYYNKRYGMDRPKLGAR